MKIAIIGGGISGLCCAHLLHRTHDVTLFESQHRIGGHSHTATIQHEGATLDVDTGFIVFNTRNYPNFTKLLSQLNVDSQPAPMSFSVRSDISGLEYGGHTLRGLFAQPSNVFRPSFLRLLRDIMRLGPIGERALAELDDSTTLEAFCNNAKLSRELVDHYLIPMGAAIWSAPRAQMLQFPAKMFLRFFDNHGMLDLRKRAQWRTITGGSQRYVSRLTEPFRDRIRTGSGVRRIERSATGVTVLTASARERFDEVILACHADESLALLGDPSRAEAAILAALPYQANTATLHTDSAVLPRKRAAWAGWNYRILKHDSAPVQVTYNLSLLQSLPTREPVCVTLNDTGSIDPAKVHGVFHYHHPVYTVRGMVARREWSTISGVNRTHYCGAYWLNGFHEDGVNSALNVCLGFGVAL